MKISLSLIAMLIIGLGYSQDQNIPSRDIYHVSLGSSISIDTYRINFIEVVEDSRCPKNATCIWQGRAIVLIETETIENKKQQQKIIIGKINKGESANKELIITDQYTLKVTSLTPYSIEKNDVEEASYQLTINKIKT